VGNEVGVGKIAFRSRMGVVLLICLVLLSALILVSLAVGRLRTGRRVQVRLRGVEVLIVRFVVKP